MKEVILTAIASLCWMIFRFYQLLKTPTAKLGSSLNLEIPHTPVISFDWLDDTSVVLHWDIETLPDENIFYVILINGSDLGTLAFNAVRLTNLNPEFMYRIQIVAINAISSFRSQSDAVYFRTLPKNSQGVKPAYLGRKKRVPRANSKLYPALDLEIPLSAISELSAEELVLYLHASQAESARVYNEFQIASSSQKEREPIIRAQILQCKRELRDGAEARAKQEGDLKQLEQKKDLLTFQKLKLLKQLKIQISQKTMNEKKMQEFRLRITKLTEKSHHAENTARAECEKNKAYVEAVNREIDPLKERFPKMEESIKQSRLKKKDIATTVAQLRPLVEKFTALNQEERKSSQDLTKLKWNPIFNLDGGLTELGNEIFSKIYLLLPEWTQSVNHELEVLHSTFRLSLCKYLSVCNNLEALKASNDPLYVPKRKSEFQAGLELGAHLYALHKPQNASGELDFFPEDAKLLADNRRDLSWTVEHRSPVLSSQASLYNTQPVELALPQTSFLALLDYPDLASHRDPQEKRPLDGWNSLALLQPINLPQNQPEMHPPMLDAAVPQIFGPSYADLLSLVTDSQLLANAFPPFAAKKTPSSNSQSSDLCLPADLSGQSYIGPDQASAFKPHPVQSNFPYIEPSLMHYPPSEPYHMYPSPSPQLQASLWNNNNQSSFVDPRQQFFGGTLPKAKQVAPSFSQQSTSPSERELMGHEPFYSDKRPFSDTRSLNETSVAELALYNYSLFYNNNGLHNNFKFPKNSIWLDVPMATACSHDRAQSGGSQLWRHYRQNVGKTRTSEFSTFLSLDFGNASNFDICLI